MNEENEKKTVSGIILTTTEQAQCNKGVVHSLGAATSDELAVGDCVIFTGYKGTDVKVEGKRYVVIHEDDVLAICE